jgi:hypothetical protein
MKNRRRKGIRGLILALATAAILVPAASGEVTLAEGSSATQSGYTPQALSERSTRPAESYQAQRPDDRGGIRGVEPSRSVGQPIVHADDRAGVRGPGPIETPVVVTSHGDGFDWTDAGIGASIAVFAAAALLGGALMARRRRTGLAV